MDQTPPPNIVIDCAAFEKKSDDSWLVLRPTTVQIGGASVELKEATLTSNTVIRIGGKSLVDYLNEICK